MLNFTVLLRSVVLFVVLAVPGFVLGRLKRLDIGARAAIGGILGDVAMPALVLARLLEADLSALDGRSIAWALLLPFGLTAVLWGLSTLLFPHAEGCGRRHGAARFCAVFANCGFLGIPLTEAMFPGQPEVVVYVSLFNVSSTLCLLTLGIYMLSGDRANVRLRAILCKPIVWVVVLGAVLTVTGWKTHLPRLVAYANYPAQLTTPLSMLVLGCELSGLRLRAIFGQTDLYKTALVKLIAAPVLSMLILRLCGAPAELAAAMFLATGVSTAASAPAMAGQYGTDAEYTATLTLGTTLLCIATLPMLSLLFELLF
ncbi:MAG: AEC family transporter [Clostridia bacterium]|nr:AEC family transporter [Clostridia bacterium]